MKLTTTSFRANEEMPPQYGKEAQNVSPQLAWQDAPAGVQSFALAVVDRHPIAQNYVHWLVADIPADVSTLAEGAATNGLPAGARELVPYAGPFPPAGSGTHTYEFTLYALDVSVLDLPTGAALDDFIAVATPSAIATAQLVGLFTKS